MIEPSTSHRTLLTGFFVVEMPFGPPLPTRANPTTPGRRRLLATSGPLARVSPAWSASGLRPGQVPQGFLLGNCRPRVEPSESATMTPERIGAPCGERLSGEQIEEGIGEERTLAEIGEGIVMMTVDKERALDIPEGKTAVSSRSGAAGGRVPSSLGNGPDAFCPGCTHFSNKSSTLHPLRHGGPVRDAVVRWLEQFEQYRAQMGWTCRSFLQGVTRFADTMDRGLFAALLFPV